MISRRAERVAVWVADKSTLCSTRCRSQPRCQCTCCRALLMVAATGGELASPAVVVPTAAQLLPFLRLRETGGARLRMHASRRRKCVEAAMGYSVLCTAGSAHTCLCSPSGSIQQPPLVALAATATISAPNSLGHCVTRSGSKRPLFWSSSWPAFLLASRRTTYRMTLSLQSQSAWRCAARGVG